MNEAEYLNVDLELDSEADLSPLAEHLGDSVFVLFNGRVHDVYRLALETSCTDEPELANRDSSLDADACIREFLTLVAQLPSPLRSLWDGCLSRVFDIGITAGAAPSAFIQTVCETTVHAITSVGGAIRVTIYPPRLEPNKGT
jgi:hypothetical protein